MKKGLSSPYLKPRSLVKCQMQNIHETYRLRSPLEEIPFDEKQSQIKSELMKMELREELQDLPKLDPKLKFGSLNTDYQLEIDHLEQEWQPPVIKPFQHLHIHPFSSSLHYAVQCFEGMKAFRDSKGNVRLFRPMLNMNRFRRSCLRISLPDFNTQGLYQCIEHFLKVEQRWVPDQFGFSLYIRPTGISMSDTLGVRSPDKSKIFVVASPVGPYYPAGFKPISLYCDHKNIRAAPLGFGQFKLGSNYGPTIALSKLAENNGFEQILWMYNNQVLEVGTSNLFIFWKNSQGQQELVTPQADDLILHGVTRDSVIQLAQGLNRFPVVQRDITIDEIITSIRQGRMIEMFTCGTAVTIGPVNRFRYKDEDYKVPIVENQGAGDLAKELCDKLNQIYYGQIDHPWSKVIN